MGLLGCPKKSPNLPPPFSKQGLSERCFQQVAVVRPISNLLVEDERARLSAELKAVGDQVAAWHLRESDL